MTRTFIQTREFSERWDRLGFHDDDLRMLELEILADPTAAPVITGTGGLRKKRFSLHGKGKRGGVRVCYVDYVFCETVYFITVYAKTDKDNLSKQERNEIHRMIEQLRNNLRGGSDE